MEAIDFAVAALLFLQWPILSVGYIFSFFFSAPFLLEHFLHIYFSSPFCLLFCPRINVKFSHSAIVADKSLCRTVRAWKAQLATIPPGNIHSHSSHIVWSEILGRWAASYSFLYLIESQTCCFRVLRDVQMRGGWRKLRQQRNQDDMRREDVSLAS